MEKGEKERGKTLGKRERGAGNSKGRRERVNGFAPYTVCGLRLVLPVPVGIPLSPFVEKCGGSPATRRPMGMRQGGVSGRNAPCSGAPPPRVQVTGGLAGWITDPSGALSVSGADFVKKISVRRYWLGGTCGWG